ncbi:hypothetical protein, partial [Saccharopolyspora sp. NPDC002578]
FSLRDLFPEWLRHEGKSRPREKNAENPLRCRWAWWSLLSGFAADRTQTKNAAHQGTTRSMCCRSWIIGGARLIE